MSEVSALPLHNRLSETATHIIHGIRAHALLYIFAAFVCAVAIAESLWLGLPIDLQMVMIFSGPVLMLLGVMIFLGLVLELIRLNRTNYPGSALGGLWLKIRDDYLSPQRVSNSIHAFLFMTLYMVGFSFIKKAIPLAVPFSWDETFMQWDQVLHFGRHPYEWLAPLLNLPWVTFLINVNYNIWFFVMFTCWYWQGFAAPGIQRCACAFCWASPSPGSSAPAYWARSFPPSVPVSMAGFCPALIPSPRSWPGSMR